MEQCLNNNLHTINVDEFIEKAFRKYTFEVSDAIEAHGFKATSYTDYAKDIISELSNSIKIQFKQGCTESIIFANLENSLNDTIQNIVNHTSEGARLRNKYYIDPKLNEKVAALHNSLEHLNTRLLNSLENI